MRATTVSEFIRRNVLGVAAIFIALAGTAVASLPGTNTVDSGDIINGEVKTADIGAAAVTTGRLDTDAVTSPKVLNNTLGGADINESLLDGGAITGVDAASVNGREVQDIGSAFTTGGITAFVSCNSGPDFTTILADTTVDNSQIYLEIAGADEAFDADFDDADGFIGATVDGTGPNEIGEATLMFKNGTTGRVVSANFAFRSNYSNCNTGGFHAFGRLIG